jgi:glycosyltransferase involved in cell wall biosynthesis
MPAHATIINDGYTGLLCESPESYLLALKNLEDSAANYRFGKAAREWASHEIGTWDDCAQRYTRIYRKLLGNDTGE